MKYSMTTFDNALNHLLPNIAKAKKMGVNFDRPTLINMVAAQHFICDWDDRRDYEQQVAYYVVKQAAIELKETGVISFGKTEYGFS